ncbi:MAG TPA: hypothetical protein VFA81_01115 [Burkholderiales bacterium]|nr:hypothetical protein [Burkholderiales bacterium]
MNIAAHLEKLRRTQDVRSRLDPMQDFELWFWMSMIGGTHAINAALHHVGATDPGEYFCTQSVDVYLEQGDAPGTWKHSLRYGCDIVHVGMPKVQAKLPCELEDACDAMMVLEHLRDPCIRGDHTITPADIAAVDRAYVTCLRLTQQVLEPTAT